LGLGFFVCRLVPLAFHRVLGPLEREPVATQQAAELVRADTNAGGLGQVRPQPSQRPGGKPVPKSKRIGHHGPAHLLDEFGRGLSRPTRRLDRLEGLDAALAIQAANSDNRVGAATQMLGNIADGVAGVRHENNQAISENIRGLGGEAKTIQFVPLLFRELDAPTHDALLAAPPPRNTASSLEKLNGSICVPT
jgi:hypothetical protein